MSETSEFGWRYEREFKEKAVALVLGGRSQGEVSRDLGVSAWSLGEWVRKARAAMSRLRRPPSVRRPMSSVSCGGCGRNRVARLMRAQGLRARQKRRFRPRTTDSRGCLLGRT